MRAEAHGVLMPSGTCESIGDAPAGSPKQSADQRRRASDGDGRRPGRRRAATVGDGVGDSVGASSGNCCPTIRRSILADTSPSPPSVMSSHACRDRVVAVEVEHRGPHRRRLLQRRPLQPAQPGRAGRALEERQRPVGQQVLLAPVVVPGQHQRHGRRPSRRPPPRRARPPRRPACPPLLAARSPDAIASPTCDTLAGAAPSRVSLSGVNRGSPMPRNRSPPTSTGSVAVEHDRVRLRRDRRLRHVRVVVAAHPDVRHAERRDLARRTRSPARCRGR